MYFRKYRRSSANKKNKDVKDTGRTFNEGVLRGYLRLAICTPSSLKEITEEWDKHPCTQRFSTRKTFRTPRKSHTASKAINNNIKKTPNDRAKNKYKEKGERYEEIHE